MKMKIRAFISIFIMIFFLNGCVNLNMDTREKISKPNNKSIPISGVWSVISYIGQNSEIKKGLGEKKIHKIEFSPDFVRIGKDVCYNPIFKIKTVKTNQYLIYAYNKTKEELGIDKDEINIISITSGEKHFYDVIYIDSNNAIIHAFNSFINIKKESSEVEENIKDASNEKSKVFKEEKKNNKKPLKSTVYIGLRGEGSTELGRNTSNIKKVTTSKYKTIAINTKDKEVKEIIEVQDLVIPRMTGFWSLSPDRRVINDAFIEGFSPYIIEDRRHIDKDLNVNPENLIPILKDQSMVCNINFISNDYVGIEYGIGKDPSNINKNRFAVFPLDNLKKGPLKVYDIFKEQEPEDFSNIEDEFLSKEMIAREENFSLLRKNGHWIAVGRAEDKKNEHKYEDYILNLVPTNGIMNYDELCVSWNDIKSKVPDAVDAFTSPNKDILIIINKKSLMVYSLTNEDISKKPIEVISMEDNEKVVMIEWAVGEYAEKWKKMSEYMGTKVSN